MSVVTETIERSETMYNTYADAVRRQTPTASEPQSASPKAGSTGAKLDQVPDPHHVTLFRRDQVELGYRGPMGPGSGMFNMGNTCYLNSTLQVCQR